MADPQIEGGDRVAREGFYGRVNNVMNDMYMRFVYWKGLGATEAPLTAVLVRGLMLALCTWYDGLFDRGDNRNVPGLRMRCQGQ